MGAAEAGPPRRSNEGRSMRQLIVSSFVSYQLEHQTTKTVARGTHYPLGATLTPIGVNFALYSQHAAEVFLLLFDRPDGDPTDIIRLEERDRFVWHTHV